MATARPSPTPNPEALKFTLDVTLPATIDARSPEASGGDPFVAAVLAAEGVASLYGVGNVVTVRRRPGAEWADIVCAVQEAAERFLPGGAPDQAAERVAAARRLLREAVCPPTPVEVRIRRGARPAGGGPSG